MRWLTGVPLVLCMVSMAIAEDPGDLQMQIERQMTALANRQPMPPVREIRPDEVDEFIAILEPYRRHENERVRQQAYGLECFQLAMRTSDADVRRQAVTRLTEGLKDPSPLVSQFIARLCLQRFEAADFSQEAQEIIRALVLEDRPDGNVIRLVGMVQMRDMAPRLREIIAEESELPRRERTWPAQLALARMGDLQQLRRIIERVEGQQEERRRLALLSNLGFTRQPEAVQVLVRYLNSDEVVPQDHDVLPWAHAHAAATVLAETVDGFPLESKRFYSQDEITEARAWVARQRNLRIRR